MEPASESGRPEMARVWPIALVAVLVVTALVILLRVGGSGPDEMVSLAQDTDVELADDVEDLHAPRLIEARDPVDDRAAPEEATEEPAIPVAPVPVPVPEGERLVVRVLDAQRTPVEGVSVEWVAVHPSYGTNEQRIEGRTDSGGYIVPENAARTLAMRFGGEDSPMQGWMLSRLGLRCTLPFEAYEPRDAADPAGVVWLENEPDEGAVVDVVLPPAGVVRFEWDPLLRAGEPVLDGYFLHIRRSDGQHFPRWRTGFTVPPGTTQHRFAPVGTGWEVYADLSHPKVLGSLGSVREPGPTSDRETVVLRIERAEAQRDLVELAGVATDSDGAPLAETRVRVSLGDPDVGGTPGRSVVTDEAGAWSMLVARTRLRELGGGIESGDRGDGSGGGGEVTLSASIAGEKCRGSAVLEVGDAARDRYELGPVALVVPPAVGPEPILIASGRVTDVAGEPLRGAYVRASVHATSVGGEAVEDPDDWTRLQWKRTGRDGRYELRALVELADATVKVHASHQDHLKVEPVEVLAGRTDLDFVLTRGLAVTLAVDLEPWAAVAEVVSLRFTGEGRSHSPSLMDFVGHYQGSFSGLLPGRYHLKVRLRTGDWVLFEQEIDVQSDVDLGTLDLRGKLAICSVEVLDEHGAPFAERYVRVHDVATGVEIDDSANVGDGGIVRFVVPLDVQSVRLVSHSGASAVVSSSAFSIPEPGIVPQRVAVTLSR